ncbi:SCPL47 [Acrasis kona]|uniref:Carboxypeptidase n=1 Tax=Acrasis kona TaxID=1008807 RepID=A0AAW2YV04_9EUKA
MRLFVVTSLLTIISLVLVYCTKDAVRTLPTVTSWQALPEMFTGYLTASNNNQIFYLMVKNDKPNAPVVVFLNGGPGCSSMVGAFLENGPFLLETTNLISNTESWHLEANMLYIDNPVGSGFSFNANPQPNYPSTTEQSASDLSEAIKLIFAADHFPELTNNPLYVFGESYGGRFAIALASSLAKYRKVAGVGIGNAWINPDVQQNAYGLQAYAMGLSNYKSYVDLRGLSEKCHQLINNGQYQEAEKSYCSPLINKVLAAGGDVNEYDFRTMGSYQSLKQLETFLSQKNVGDALSTKTNYVQCSQQTWQNFLPEFQSSYENELSKLLDGFNNTIKVLVYNGQYDIRCATMGTSDYLRNLKWSGSSGFNYADKQTFYDSQNQTLGTFKSHKNLQQVVIYNAGHMAPMDQRQSTRVLLSRFINSTNGLMCLPNDVKCLAAKNNCPNECSGHGKCVEGTCQCFIGYSQEDCSSYVNNILFGSSVSFSGYTFGRQMHTYQLHVGRGGIGSFDVTVKLTKKTNQGKLHLYLHGGDSYIYPNSSSRDALVGQFEYHNLEDVNEKVLVGREQRRNNATHITLVVYNTVDTDSNYGMTVITSVTGNKFNGLLVVSSIVLSVTGVVAVILFVYALVQYLLDREFLKSNYESPNLNVHYDHHD